MTSFKQFYEQKRNNEYVNFFAATDVNGPKGSRHRADIIGDVGTRKHVQTVPEYKKAKSDIIQKVEKLKDRFSHYEPVNNIQLKQICQRFKIFNLQKDMPKKLGNTGIALVWDNGLKSFAIKK